MSKLSNSREESGVLWEDCFIFLSFAEDANRDTLSLGGQNRLLSEKNPEDSDGCFLGSVFTLEILFTKNLC